MARDKIEDLYERKFYGRYQGEKSQMPEYEYRCESCGEKFLRFFHTIRKMEEGPAPECPKCGHEAKMLLASGMRFQFDTGSFFEPYIDTDITGSPIKIETQDQFFRECEKHGSGYRKIRDKMR